MHGYIFSFFHTQTTNQYSVWELLIILFSIWAFKKIQIPNFVTWCKKFKLHNEYLPWHCRIYNSEKNLFPKKKKWALSKLFNMDPVRTQLVATPLPDTYFSESELFFTKRQYKQGKLTWCQRRVVQNRSFNKK